MMRNAVSVASWASDRLDIFGLGTDNQMYHKAWDGNNWLPSVTDWEPLGGVFNSPPTVVSWASDRLDIFALGADNQMYHKAWDGNNWLPSVTDWEPLGGVFNSPPTVVSWASDRLDIFALGTDNQMYHKAWDGNNWLPSVTDWEPLGSVFNSPPAVVSWASDRLDIFALGADNQMYHKAWDGNNWLPSVTDWEPLGGVFNSPPAVVSWASDRLDIFALGADNQMYHKAWDGSNWLPSVTDWEPLGGVFNSPPAVVSWANDRLDIFALGADNQMYHKAWDGSNWLPSVTDWEPLGGVFNSPPAVISWANDRLDIFALGANNQMYHKAWDGSNWLPSVTGWEPLGGVFNPGIQQFPWAVILCRFKGGQGDANIEQFIRQSFAPGSGGLVEYWRDISLEAVDISNSKIFGWVELEITRIEAGGKGRTALVNEAKKAAKNAGIDVETAFFSQIAIFTHDWSRDDIDRNGPDRYNYWLDGSSDGRTVSAPPHGHSGSFLAHEMAHVHGLVHDYGADLRSAYGDPFCIMSAMNINSFNHPSINKSFGPSLCLPHLTQKGWMNLQRIHYDDGNWMTQSNGITLPLATVNDPNAPANLGVKLAYKSSRGTWDYYLEFVRPISWNQGFDDSYLLIRRIFVSGEGETSALLGKIKLPSEMNIVAEFIEPSGNVKFKVERFNSEGRIVKVTAQKL